MLSQPMGFFFSFFLPYRGPTSLARAVISVWISCLRSASNKRRELVEHLHTSKGGRGKLEARPARHTGADDGALRAFLADEAVGNGGNSEGHRGKEGKREALGGTESRRDLPVGFRCGKCWLPVDSIRASSGSHVKEQGEREEREKKEGGAGVRKGNKREGGWKDEKRRKRRQRRKAGWSPGLNLCTSV